MSNSESVKEEYDRIWREFVEGVRRIHRRLSTEAPDVEGRLHKALQEVREVPYQQARALLSDSDRINIGSVTGVFFEQTVVSLVVPAVRAALPEVRVQRNRHAGRPPQLPRDPDLCLGHGDREVVDAGIDYFLVGGYVSADGKLIDDLVREGWTTFAHASTRNRSLLEHMPSLDDLVGKAVTSLRAS